MEQLDCAPDWARRVGHPPDVLHVLFAERGIGASCLLDHRPDLAERLLQLRELRCQRRALLLLALSRCSALVPSRTGASALLRCLT